MTWLRRWSDPGVILTILGAIAGIVFWAASWVVNSNSAAVDTAKAAIVSSAAAVASNTALATKLDNLQSKLPDFTAINDKLADHTRRLDAQRDHNRDQDLRADKQDAAINSLGYDMSGIKVDISNIKERLGNKVDRALPPGGQR